jgi:hypothetical protein
MGDLDEPTELALSLSPEVEVVYQNTLGEMEIRVLLDELLGQGHRNLADGWDGDHFALVARPGSGPEGLVWVSIWDSEPQRDAFVTGLQPGLSRLPEPADLVAGEVLGRPGAILRVGAGQGVDVQISEGRAG